MIPTIVAIATPIGHGGVGVIRISGPLALEVAKVVVGAKTLSPRQAVYTKFFNSKREPIDSGIALFFPGPNSFTGEDVVELQGHGSPVVQQMILDSLVAGGAVMARPGEFSERAFLNNKIDLAQAEAIADLITAGTSQAARAAQRTLAGEFSKKINLLLEQLIQLRMYVEAAIDFPEEEIDFLEDQTISSSLNQINQHLSATLSAAQSGQLLQHGVDVAIIGNPNVGKSTLLNALTGEDTAIVTNVAGTTRDIVKAQVNLGGVVLNFIDTAGLRETDDQIELEGMRRTMLAVNNCNLVLLLFDAATLGAAECPRPEVYFPELVKSLDNSCKLIIVINKSDLVCCDIKREVDKYPLVVISAKEGLGIEDLKLTIQSELGMAEQNDGQSFTARSRHVHALQAAKQHVDNALKILTKSKDGELVAEELHIAQKCLAEITGEFSSDDLLGKIFSEFCIGK